MPTDPRDYRIEISGLEPNEPSRKAPSRPYLSVHFKCCGVYCRVYRNAEATAYVGRCPKCTRSVRFLVAEGGSDERFFTVE